MFGGGLLPTTGATLITAVVVLPAFGVCGSHLNEFQTKQPLMLRLSAPAHTNTAGASGLIFGLFGFLLVSGFVERRPLGVVVGLLIGAIWGGSILLGLSPLQTGVSWQAHLIGLATGVAAAFWFRRRAQG